MQKDQTFSAWLANFRKTHLGRYNDFFLDKVFCCTDVIPQVLHKDQNQDETKLSLADYINRFCSHDRLVKGQLEYAKWSEVLDKIEEDFGVPATVLLALWGIETNYGTARGDISTLSALATLAFDGRRCEFFQQELCAAVEILHKSPNSEKDLIGSWAGAMGHTQFMPSTYLKYAVDFVGKGWADLWSDNPVDSLASAAYYLSFHGWNPHVPWGCFVSIPQHFDYSLTAPKIVKTVSEFLDLGLGGLPNKPDALGSVIVPMGACGPAFWISDNFSVLKRYNNSMSYALSIGLLSDGFNDGALRHLGWPRNTAALSRGDVQKLQSILTDHGFDTQGCDGISGSNTENAIRKFQNKNGITEDGYPSHKLLDLVSQKLT